MGPSAMPPPPTGPAHFGATTDGRAAPAIVASVRAHPVLVVLVTVATVVAGLGWSATRSPSYETSAQILLTPLPETGRSLPRLPVLRASSERTRLVQTAASLLDSPAAASSTARAMGEGWTAGRVASSVDVEPEGESDVLAVTAKADDPEVAARLANEFARASLDARNRALRPIVESLTAEVERDLGAQPDPSSPVAVDLAERLADLRAIGTEGDPTLSLTRLAEPSTSPVGPPRSMLVVLSLLAGIAVGLGTALVVDMLGPPRVADAGQAIAATGLPVLARVPALGLLQRTRGSPMKFRPSAAVALRMLQHQLESQPEARRRVLLAGVSSGDGVTTSAVELGLTLIRVGHKVLLVDVDTREPELATRLGAPSPPALSAVLGAGDEWENGVVAVPGAPGLKLLAVGAQGSMGIPDDLAAELPRVLAQACHAFDYVLLDAPPLAESGEALQVAPAVDAVVLVLRPGRTRLADLEAGIGMLERAGRRPEGLLLVGGRGPAPPTAASPVGRHAERAHAGARGRTVQA